LMATGFISLVIIHIQIPIETRVNKFFEERKTVTFLARNNATLVQTPNCKGVN
jgi:hypothetical protein